MAIDPYQVVDRYNIWLDEKGNELKTNIGAKSQASVMVYGDGSRTIQIWDPRSGKWSDPQPYGSDPTWTKRYYEEGQGTAPKAPTTRDDPYGNVQQYNAETGEWGPAPGMPVKPQATKAPEEIAKDEAYTSYYNAQTAKIIAETPDPQERALRLRELEARIASAMRGNTRTSAQEAADAAQARLYGAQASKAERDLMNPYVLRQQQLMEAVSAIQEQIARGDITPEEGTNLINLTRQNLDASLRGTTPWQMEQDRKNREQVERQNRASAAGSFISNRGQLGGSLATGFLSGLGGIYANTFAKYNPPSIDPIALALSTTNQLSGGQDMNDMALALLRGYLGQGGA